MESAGASRKQPHSSFNGSAERRHVFIVTYGRSGSTLLMNIINSCEGCCIRGENNSALYNLFESYKSVLVAKRDHEKYAGRTIDPWWGIHEVDPDAYARRLAEVFIEEIVRPKPEDHVCGFKEIRFLKEDMLDLEEYIKFMIRIFPRAKVIINHRNIADVARSKWWREVPDALEVLGELDGRLKEYDDPERVFHFFYDRALQDRSHIQELLAFLSLPYEEHVVGEVFAVRHSY